MRNFPNEKIAKLDDLDQYGRRENLEFEDIPYEENKNTTDVVIKLVETFEAEIERFLLSIARCLLRKCNSKRKH